MASLEVLINFVQISATNLIPGAIIGIFVGFLWLWVYRLESFDLMHQMWVAWEVWLNTGYGYCAPCITNTGTAAYFKIAS